MLFQISRDGYEYHVGVCDKLTRPGCEQSSLCRLRHDADVLKYTFNKMIPESGHLKLVYNLVSPSSTCSNNGNNRFYVIDHSF